MKRILFSLSLLALSSAEAFLPNLGHLVRHQPMMLKASPQAFTVDGSIEIEGEKAPFKLTWSGVKDGYAVEFKKIPSSWTASNISELILFRNASTCMLLINKTANPCSTLRFWGDFEFNSNGDRAAQTVVALGIASSSDVAFKSINSKDVGSGKRSTKVKAVLKNVQGTFLSLLEFSNTSGSFVAFDSINYAPLMARFPVDGMMWDFAGDPDFHLERAENKNNVIVSRKIEVREGGRLVATVKREPLKRGSKLSLPAMPSSKASVSDVPYSRFSDRGRDFLKVLFLTH